MTQVTNCDQSEQRTSGLYAFLTWPTLYEALQNVLGQRHAWRRYVEEFVTPKPGMRILDIGCGPGTVLNYLPESVEYTGFDLEPNCIRYAQDTYGSRGQFFCQRVSESTVARDQGHDLVMANAVLHHLDDVEGAKLFQTAYDALLPDGYMVVFDPVFVERQNFLAHYLIARDRGRFVRTPDQYLALPKQFFPRVEGVVVHDLYRIPYTIFIMKCYKS
jgi:2-polyprenyl-3-methyl-5-hydroxy-6-metoxy-1,4-benzoquinol methylase